MKKIRLIAAIVAILSVAVSCESIGLFGYGGVKGSQAKKEIKAVAEETGVISGVLNNSSANGIALSLLIDGVVVPSLADINDSSHYSRPSVDDCKKNIASVGLVLGTWIGAITCDLKKTPMLLQIGDGDTGNVLQLGPLGL